MAGRKTKKRTAKKTSKKVKSPTEPIAVEVPTGLTSDELGLMIEEAATTVSETGVTGLLIENGWKYVPDKSRNEQHYRLYELAAERLAKLGNIVELGTFVGAGTRWLFTGAWNSGIRLISVDSDHSKISWPVAPRPGSSNDVEVVYVEADSTDDLVADAIGDDGVALAVLDTSHSPDIVAAEFEFIKDRIVAGGLILIDDINVKTMGNWFADTEFPSFYKVHTTLHTTGLGILLKT